MGSCAGNKQDGPSPDRTRRRRFCRSMDYVSKVGSADWEQCARTRQKGEAEEQVVIEVDGRQAAGDGRDRRKGMKYWRRVCGECCGQTRTHSAKNSRIRREVTGLQALSWWGPWGGRERVEFNVDLDGPRPFLRRNSGELSGRPTALEARTQCGRRIHVYTPGPRHSPGGVCRGTGRRAAWCKVACYCGPPAPASACVPAPEIRRHLGPPGTGVRPRSRPRIWPSPKFEFTIGPTPRGSFAATEPNPSRAPLTLTSAWAVAGHEKRPSASM